MACTVRHCRLGVLCEDGAEHVARRLSLMPLKRLEVRPQQPKLWRPGDGQLRDFERGREVREEKRGRERQREAERGRERGRGREVER